MNSDHEVDIMNGPFKTPGGNEAVQFIPLQVWKDGQRYQITEVYINEGLLCIDIGDIIND